MGLILIEPDERGNTRAREVDDDEIRRVLAPSEPVDADGFYARRQLPDGRWLAVVPLIHQRARLGIVADLLPNSETFPGGLTDPWDYPNRELAISAMSMWGGHGTPAGGQRPRRTFR
jgi:hypothetical protein